MGQFSTRQRLDDLLPLVYDQLRAYASRVLDGENSQVALQTTELVHEVYLRLGQLREIRWENELEMLRTAVAVMRRVLVDQSRSRNRLKRRAPGFRVEVTSLEEAIPDQGTSVDLVELDEALQKLEEWDSRKAEIVSLRYFGGLSIEQVAETMGVSLSTVKRDWAIARAWLYRELSDEESNKK